MIFLEILEQMAYGQHLMDKGQTPCPFRSERGSIYPPGSCDDLKPSLKGAQGRECVLGNWPLASTQGSRAEVWCPSPESARQSSNPGCFSTPWSPGVSPLRVNECPRSPVPCSCVRMEVARVCHQCGPWLGRWHGGESSWREGHLIQAWKPVLPLAA